MLILVLLILFIGVIIYMTDLKHHIKYIDLRSKKLEPYDDELEDELANLHDEIARDPDGGKVTIPDKNALLHIKGRRLSTNTKAYMQAMSMRDQDMNDNIEGLNNNEYVTIPSKRGRLYHRQQSDMDGKFN